MKRFAALRPLLPLPPAKWTRSRSSYLMTFRLGPPGRVGSSWSSWRAAQKRLSPRRRSRRPWPFISPLLRGAARALRSLRHHRKSSSRTARPLPALALRPACRALASRPIRLPLPCLGTGPRLGASSRLRRPTMALGLAFLPFRVAQMARHRFFARAPFPWTRGGEPATRLCVLWNS